MLIKKPYAFIIKHFRLIHLIMLFCCGFFLFVSSDINSLFGTLQKTNTLTYAGAANMVNNIVYYVGILLIILSGGVFWLLREKKKPTKFYLLLMVYAILEIVLFFIVFRILGTMEENLVELDQLILGRDLTNICIYPNYFFIVICFIRGIGFNLKQFNFSKDVEELEIVDKDSAEFEVLIGQNNYKYARLFRRGFRETKYYILENLFSITVFICVIILFFIGYGIYYYTEYLKKMGDQEATNVNGITYTVKDAYITSHDLKGYTVKDGYKYVVINMSFYNSNLEPTALNLDIITLVYGKLRFYPNLQKNQKFYDLGTPYNNKEKIQPGSELNATLTFEIPDSVSIKNFELRVEYALDTSTKKIISKYRRFDIGCKLIDKKLEESYKNINDKISINPVELNPFDITILGYDISDSYVNKYTVCKTLDNCFPISNIIKPDSVSNQTMLIINFDGMMYEDSNFTRQYNTYNKIFENFATIEYSLYSKVYKVPVKVVKQSDVEDRVFITMDRKFKDATNITLRFDFRDLNIRIPLVSK